MAKAAKSARLYFNGVNGATGQYGLAPMTGDQLAKLIRGEAPPDNLDELRLRHQQSDADHYGVKEGVDPKLLDESGWGVVFPHRTDPALVRALRPLLDLRRQQAGGRFRIFDGPDGYRPGESKTEFLARHGAGPGPADPDRVPYYLLLVGSPSEIPYGFQSQLDVQYAVGRVHFDAVEDYARYAESVLAAESGKVKLPRRLTFFGVSNEDDPSTRSSCENLVTPLHRDLGERKTDWEVEALVGERATKASLAELLGGDATPALLFTASHGMEFPNGDSRQRAHQGALLCQDWPGPEAWRARGPIPPEFYFAGDDLSGDAGLLGLLGFCFACYGGGTPLSEEFSTPISRDRTAIAPHPFLAALPQKMLSHPRGGALAVVGHVERAWGYSFHWKQAGPQTTVFESAIERLLDGHPVGSALEYFNERYAELSTVLSEELKDIEFGKRFDPEDLAALWTANNDARGYIVIGDPAVRLPVAAPGEEAARRPVIEVRLEGPREAESRKKSAPGGGSEVAAEPFFGVSARAPEASEDVQFRVFHPRAIEPDVWRKLLVYVHLSEELSAVKRDAGQRLGRSARGHREAEVSAPTRIAPGTEMTLVPEIEGFVFEPARRVVRWTAPWVTADFQMKAVEARVGHVASGSIACYVGALLVADLGLEVVVTSAEQAAAVPTPDGESATSMYRSIFSSYSHEDSAIVEAVARAYQAVGIENLRDSVHLKSGQDWSQELLDMIERADVFQLFWSSHSCRSPYVEQEWRHALELRGQKGDTFIRPVYWEESIPPIPDEQLARIHFARVDLEGKEGRKEAMGLAAETEPARTVVFEGKSLETFEVSTYRGGGGEEGGLQGEERLFARTRVSLGGDLETHLFQEEGASEHLFRLHEEMVREALRTRIAYLEVRARAARPTD